MKNRSLIRRARRLVASLSASREAVLQDEDDRTRREHALACLRALLTGDPLPVLPPDVAVRIAKRRASEPPVDEAAVLERLRRLLREDTADDRRKLPPHIETGQR